MNNPETLATSGTKDTWRRQAPQKHTTTRVGHYHTQHTRLKQT